MVLLEAMYYGLPVFTTYNGGSSTLINNENGIIIENTDCNEWSEKIVKVLSDKKRM
ncbi:MAG: glycosyltransferase family 4 protein [Coprococcus comes]